MSFLTDDVMAAILDNLWGDQTYALVPPGTWYIALYSVAPNPDGTGGVEVSWDDYARVAVTNDLTEWPAASAGAKHNASLLDFGIAGSGPTDVLGYGFLDDPTAGDLWAYIDLDGAPVTIGNGTPVSFAINAIDLAACAS